MNLFRTRWTAKAGIKLRNKDRVGTERLNLIGKRFVESLDDRHHEDDRYDADTDAENRQRRTQLVRAQRVERHQGGFLYVVKLHRD